MKIIKKIQGLFSDTPKPESTVDENKKQFDLDKVQLEIKLLKKNIANYSNQQRLEKIRIWLTFFTTIIGFTGIFIAYISQQKQLENLKVQRLDDDYSKRVELLLKSTSEEYKLAAISNLSLYLQPNYDTVLQNRLIDLLIYYAQADTLFSVKESIAKELISKVPDKTFQVLYSQNKSLYQPLLEDYYIYMDFDSLIWSNAQQKKLLSLDWSVTTMVSCINKIGQVNYTDFSSFAFEIPWVLKNKLIKITGEQRNPNVVSASFKNVDFSHAYLPYVKFKNCTFENVKFDSSILDYTLFKNCNFDNDCSFEGVGWSSLYNNNSGVDTHPFWDGCTIYAQTFSPYLDSDVVVKPIADTELFFSSKWKFQKVASTPSIKIRKESRSQ